MAEQHSSNNESHGIQALLDEFSLAWTNQSHPDITAYVQRAAAPERELAIEKLVREDADQRRKRGETPKPNDYFSRFPDHRTIISRSLAPIQETYDSSSDLSRTMYAHSDVDIQIGDRLGKYEIRSVLGVGGMGVVFGAFDNIIQRDVAIKLLSTKHSTNSTALSRLLQEARSAGALHHPNIVGIYDVVEEHGAYYVVMEKVNGDNLSEVLEKSERGRLDWGLATKIMIDCCEALNVAHSRGLVHRDIKPQNIMLTVESVAKLLDFGLAKSETAAEPSLTKEGTVVGTPDYMSPEQCSSGAITPQSDLYSLGATYYALLSGQAPFASQGSYLRIMFAHCNQPVPSLRECCPDVPEACEALIRRAMAKQPEDRYQTALDLKRDLEAIRSGSAATRILPETSHRRQVKRSKRPVPWISITALIMLTLAGGYMLFSSLLSTSPNADKRQAADVAPLFRGVTPDEIHLGTTTAFNGPNEELGRNMVVGMKTYFEHVNDSGGIHGRKIKLTVLDDGYRPAAALANMKNLFEDRRVFATLGNVGTPTAMVTAKYASKSKYLFFAPLTGANLLREDPPDRYLFNFRASYQDETEAMVRYFIEARKLKPEQIAVFAQNDSFGDDGFVGVARSMRTYGVAAEDILRVGYDRNQIDVSSAVETVLAHEDDIQAVVMVTTYKAAARFVKGVREQKPNMLFGAVSFVGSQALAEEFREIGPSFASGVIVTQVVPPYTSNATGVLNYRDLLAKYYPEYEPGFVSMEGFIAAAIFCEGLRRAGRELTTESMVDALHQIQDFDLGIGPIIRFSPSQHQASHRVWGTMLNDNVEFVSFDLTP